MRMIAKMSTVAALLIACAVAFTPSTGRAQGVPGPSQPSYMLKVNYEKTVAAGAVINTGVIDFSRVTSLEVLVDNSAGGSSRALTISWLAADKTTVLFTQAVTVTNGTRALIFVNKNAAIPSSEPTGVTHINVDPGKYMKFSLAAAGAAAGTVAIYGR